MSEGSTQHKDISFADIRKQFPILEQTCRGKPLVFLDSGASSQKPQCVIDAVSNYYSQDNANVHRGVYELSERASAMYEGVRDKVAAFIHAESRDEIIFTKGTTEAINLVASSYGELKIGQGDEIVLTQMEHHANIVPWQLLCKRVGAVLKVVPLCEDGTLDYGEFSRLLGPKTKLIGVTHISNVLGCINPIKEMITLARTKGIPVLVDGAQATSRLEVDVQALDCDFYVFSAHKMYGPTGVGVLYAKRKHLEKMQPYQGGGDMIKTVSFESTRFNELPYKFEAGTPNIAGVIGFGAALDFINEIGLDNILQHELLLTQYAKGALHAVPGLQVYGDMPDRVGVISFTMKQAHAHDIGTILDSEGVAVRVGHHCAMPLVEHYGVSAMVRASLGVYNNEQDIDALVKALAKVNELFGM